MRWSALLLVPLFVVACDREPVAPSADDAPLLGKAPADGNGNKYTAPYDFEFPLSCGAEEITWHIGGWFQARVFAQPNNRNVELDVFHIIHTFTNAAGETFVWHDVGPDHYYIDGDGYLVITITGTSASSGNMARTEIVVGHVRLNLDTGEVEFVAGRELGPLTDLACDALTS